MKSNWQWMTRGAAAGAFVLLLATPSFAQSHGWQDRNQSNGGYGQAQRGSQSQPPASYGNYGRNDRNDTSRNDGYNNRYVRNGYVRGVVDRVDLRAGTLWVRDQSTGRLMAADVRGGSRYSGINLRGLRRGDFVELTGQWGRGGVFDVASIQHVRGGGRY